MSLFRKYLQNRTLLKRSLAVKLLCVRDKLLKEYYFKGVNDFCHEIEVHLSNKRVLIVDFQSISYVLCNTLKNDAYDR